MAEEPGPGEKQHEPTQHRLDEARKRGESVKSTELTLAASYAGLLLATAGLGATGFVAFGTKAMVLLGQADSIAPLLFGTGAGSEPGSGSSGLAGIMSGFLAPVAPWFLLPAILVLIVLIAERAIVFVPDNIAPKLSRVSPLANTQQKFGREGLFDFAKSAVKLFVITLILGLFLGLRLPEMMAAIALSPGQISVLLLRLIGEFLGLALGIALVIGAIDYLWQRHMFLDRNRMTRQELLDEMKNSEGDPHVRQARRQRAREIANNRMLADVPKASVIVVNPSHYAVALKWDRRRKRAPICVAKGSDAIAARIREIAAEAGVPIRRDPPTARALFANIEIGQEILPEHYQAVAAAIRFAEMMRIRARARLGR